MVTTAKILVSFIDLFNAWGLSPNDYCLCGEYGLKIQGYSVRVLRKKHYDFFVKKSRLPWSVLRGAESTVPPKDTRYFRSFQKLLGQLKIDPHFVPIPLLNIRAKDLKKKSRIFKIDSNHKLRIIRPIDQIKNYYYLLKTFDARRRYASEKIQRWGRSLLDVKRTAQRKKEAELIVWCLKVIGLINLKLKDFLAPKSFKNGLLYGTAVYPGRIKAKVRIIKKAADLLKVKKGEIIVAPFARTEFVRIINKVSGLLTDQGGTSSHAAILSREFKIPSIIGTRFATSIFKDGDVVEVDANKGVVRKIK